MKLKKLRKIYRILFPLRLSVKELFINNLRSNLLIKEFEELKNIYSLRLTNGTVLYMRDENHSDYSVFKQIFNLEEYKIVASILKNNPEFSNETVMIDAGSNVGYATVYLQQFLKFDKIICVEPSKNNIEILSRNIEPLNCSINPIILENALAATENLSFNIEKDFRDGKDWSLTTKVSKEGKVQGVTINGIIKENDLKYITLLKIDIEGAERFIFNANNDLSFLRITKIIAIEIHDEFNIRDTIYTILKQNGFYLFESGELTIGVNNVTIQ